MFLDDGCFSRTLYCNYKQVKSNNTAVYLDDDNMNNNILKAKFLTFCFTGETKGKYHDFVGNKGTDNYTCVKCNKKYNDIINTVFTNDQFKNLLFEIETLNITNSNIIVPEVNDKLKKKINKSDNKILRIELIKLLRNSLFKDNNKNFITKYTDLLNSLGVYQNIYILDTENNEDDIIIGNDLLVNKINLLKLYINEYFRTNISLIGNKYMRENITFKMDNIDSDTKEDLQNIVYQENKIFNDFIQNNYNELFKKLKFKYTISEINSIVGIADKIDQKTNKIIIESDFDYEEAANLLENILLSSLINFIEISLKENKDEIICKFIILIFDLIINEKSLF